MSNYDEKQAAKKNYYAEKAAQLEAQAQSLYETDRQQMDLIPAGQPILVGHHSEKRHRAMIKRSHGRMAKIAELNKKAEYYRQKANTQTSAISSDDDEAVIKLKHKLAKLETYQAEMKRVNVEFRKGGVDAITGIDEQAKEKIKVAMQKYPWEKYPFPSYELTNNSAKIRSVRQRIAELETKQQKAPREAIQGNGYTVTEHPEDNRIWFQFDEKPSPAVCQIMRRHGFKFSRSRGNVWIRMLNQAGRYQADAVIEALKKI